MNRVSNLELFAVGSLGTCNCICEDWGFADFNGFVWVISAESRVVVGFFKVLRLFGLGMLSFCGTEFWWILLWFGLICGRVGVFWLLSEGLLLAKGVGSALSFLENSYDELSLWWASRPLLRSLGIELLSKFLGVLPSDDLQMGFLTISGVFITANLEFIPSLRSLSSPTALSWSASISVGLLFFGCPYLVCVRMATLFLPFVLLSYVVNIRSDAVIVWALLSWSALDTSTVTYRDYYYIY